MVRIRTAEGTQPNETVALGTQVTGLSISQDGGTVLAQLSATLDGIDQIRVIRFANDGKSDGTGPR